MSTPLSIRGVAYRFCVLTLMAIIIGTMVSYAAIGFIEGVSWLNETFLVSPRSRVQIQNQSWLILMTLAVPTLGGLLVGVLLQKLSIEKRPLGPADAIRSVQLRVATPDLRSGLVSTLASMISLGCGASVGQYGPIVYLGTLTRNFVVRLKLDIPNLGAIAVACGVSAAISTAFNAPIAGLVFAHEVILRHNSLQAFAPTTVAAAIGYVIANVVFERPPLFLVEYSGVEYGYEFVLFAILGILCAFMAVGFMRLILSITDLHAKLKLPAIWSPALAGFIVGLVALQLPDILGVGKETLRFATIEGAFSGNELLVLVAAKMMLTALCIGFGFAGGVFSPSLLIGILFGAFCWTLLEFAGVPNSGVVVYAICGMMALTSPIIGAPLTTILIVFELTRNYDLTIAAMMGVVFANLLAYRLFGRSLFDVVLARKGVDLSSGRDQAMLQHALIIDQDISYTKAINHKSSLKSAIKTLQASGRAEGAVINDKNHFIGVIRIQDIFQHTSKNLNDAIYKDTLQFDETTTLWEAMTALEGFVGDAVPVVSSVSNQLLGMITEANIINAYLKIIHGLRNEENEAV